MVTSYSIYVFLLDDIFSMSSKKAKRERKLKELSVVSDVWTPVPGLKFLGNFVHLGFAVYDADEIENVFNENSENFNFTSLSSPTVLMPFTVLKSFLGEDLSKKSLGIVILSKLDAILPAGEGWVLEGDTLPFKVGEQRSWRNPKYGHMMVEDDEEVLSVMKEEAAFYYQMFPMFKEIYKIEQVVSPAGLSDSMDKRIDTFVKTLNI